MSDPWLDKPASAAGDAFTKRGASPVGQPMPVKRVGDWLTCPAESCHGHATATEVLVHLAATDHWRIARIMETLDQLTADAAAEAEANQAERDASAKYRADSLAAFARLEQAIIDAGQVTGTPADVQTAMDALGAQLRAETAAEQQETADLGTADATATAEEPPPAPPAEPVAEPTPAE